MTVGIIEHIEHNCKDPYDTIKNYKDYVRYYHRYNKLLRPVPEEIIRIVKSGIDPEYTTHHTIWFPSLEKYISIIISNCPYCGEKI